MTKISNINSRRQRNINCFSYCSQYYSITPLDFCILICIMNCRGIKASSSLIIVEMGVKDLEFKIPPIPIIVLKNYHN